MVTGTHRSLFHLQLDHIDITIFLEPGAGARHGVGQRSGSKWRSEGVRVTTDASMTYVWPVSPNSVAGRL